MKMGYYKEKQEYEGNIECNYCGVIFLGGGGRCQSLHWVQGDRLCPECARKCAKCGKIYCPKHINNHKCEKDN